MKRKIADWVGVIFAYLLVLLINGLANGLPINGQTTGEVSDKFPSLFTPAGFTFSIWGLIYLGLAAYAIYQALPSQRHTTTLTAIGKLFIINCLANSLWIISWHYNFLVLSLVIMAVILVTLIRIYLLIKSEPPSNSWTGFVKIPFSIYLGWITVATVANASVLQFAAGWDNLFISNIDWTIAKLAIAIMIAVIVMFRERDIPFVLVIAWAAFGISEGQSATPEIVGASTIIYFIAILLVVFEVARRLTSRKRLSPDG